MPGDPKGKLGMRSNAGVVRALATPARPNVLYNFTRRRSLRNLMCLGGPEIATLPAIIRVQKLEKTGIFHSRILL